MHHVDIAQSLKEGDGEGIRRAYRLLVDYPHEAMIRDATPDSLFSAMEHVTSALKRDTNSLPSRTCMAAGLPPGSQYLDGTADFRANRIRWRRRFQSVAGGG